MRIAYYFIGLHMPRGAGVHARSVIDAWTRAGHEVLALPKNAPKDHPAIRASSPVAHSWLVRNGLRYVRGHARARLEAPSLVRSVVEFKPDVLVVRRALCDYVSDALLAKCHVPVLAEVNTVVDYEMRTLLHDPPLRPERTAERRFLRSAYCVCANTQETADLVRHLGVDPRRVFVVPNGADVRGFRPDVERNESVARWAQGRSFILGFSGSAAADTLDLPTMAEAAREISARVPGIGYLMVGIGANELQGRWPSGDLEHGRVLCTGALPHHEVPSYLVAADVCWSAFRNAYGSPLKELEYMALGKPMAIAGEGQAKKLVDEAGCGVVARRGDAAALANGVTRLINMPEPELQTLGANARSAILDHGTWAHTADGMLQAFKKVQTAAPGAL